MIFIPQKVADRLRDYIETQKIGLQKRVFPICYEPARSIVANTSAPIFGTDEKAHNGLDFGIVVYSIPQLFSFYQVAEASFVISVAPTHHRFI